MLSYIKSEWFRLLLVCIYVAVVIYCAMVGNVLAIIGWGTGAAILLMASIYSWICVKSAAEYKAKAEAKPDVVINIK